ncbi:MAG TPA: hypothetical protein PL072_07920 [Phycisphaerales bacterium]|nr:hypothetical protein [Phycisphaerales bacterium]
MERGAVDRGAGAVFAAGVAVVLALAGIAAAQAVSVAPAGGASPPTAATSATASSPGEPAAPEDRAGAGRAAEVIELRSHRRSGVVSATLVNNIVVHVRTMGAAGAPGVRGMGGGAHEPTSVVTIAIGGAELLETRENRGVSILAAGVLDSSDSGATLPGGVDVSTAVLQDAFLVRIRGTREDIRTGVAWMVDRLTQSTLDDRWVAARREGVWTMLGQAMKESGRAAAVGEALLTALSGTSDPRLLPPTLEGVQSLRTEDVQGWVRRHAEGAPIEAAVVGELSLREALEAVEPLTRLAAREHGPGEDGRGALRELPRPQSAVRVHKTQAGLEPGRCVVIAGFAGTEVSRTLDHRMLRAAAAVLSQRAVARFEQAGITSERPVTFSANPALAYPALGAVMTVVSVPSEQAEQAAGVLDSVLAEMRNRPATLEELAAVTPALAQAAGEFEHDDRAWSTLLSRSLSRGVDPESLTGGAEFYRSLTPGQVASVVERYDGAERRFLLVLCGPERE